MSQLRKAVSALSSIALVAAVPLAAACGSDSSTGNQLSNADLAGDWTMVSFQVIPQQAYTPPTTTGTLHLTNTDYHILIIMDNGSVVDTVANDSGTYDVHGSSWSQVSSDPQIPPISGAVSLMRSGNVENLEVNASAAGVSTHSIWTRQR